MVTYLVLYVQTCLPQWTWPPRSLSWNYLALPIQLLIKDEEYWSLDFPIQMGVKTKTKHFKHLWLLKCYVSTKGAKWERYATGPVRSKVCILCNIATICNIYKRPKNYATRFYIPLMLLSRTEEVTRIPTIPHTPYW